jgi:hypothetical protein
MKRISICAALAVLIAAGCGGPANKYDAVVTGTVTVDGELAESGTVVFHSIARDGKAAVGRIYPDGSYSLRTGQGNLREEDGGTVVPGEYIVTVSITGSPVESEQVIPGAPPIPGPSLVAAKYATQDTSDLKRTVKAGEQIINLELERAESPPPEDAADESEAETGAATESDAVEPATEEPSQASHAETAPEAAPATGQSAAEKSAEDPTP